MFRKSLTVFLSLVLAGSFFSTAFGHRVVVDKVVAIVGGSSILYSEVVDKTKELAEERRRQGYTSDRDALSEALESLLVQKLLYNQALIDSVGMDNVGMVMHSVESIAENMVQDAGSIGALEAKEGRPLYEIKENLRYKLEESYYADAMRSDLVSKVKITPGEVERFYRQIDSNDLPIIPEQFVYAQITRFPTNTKAAKQRVRERLLEMRERIIDGTRFDLLARMYSQDPGSARQGGEMDFMPLDGFVKPFSDAVAKLQPGQISEVVETEFGFHIIELLEKKNNLYKVRHILLRPSFTDEELVDGDRMLDSLAREIRAGAITFEAAALKYSDDKYSRHNGGVVTNHEMLEMLGASDTAYSTTRFYKEDLQMDYNTIRNMKPGQISDSYRGQDLRGNVLSKIIKLVQIIPAHEASLKEDYVALENLALSDKQGKEFDRWLDTKIESMYIRIEPEFHKENFINIKWFK